LIIVLVILLAVNLVANLFWSREFITGLGCPCEGIDGERECNDLSKSGPYFITGIFSVYQDCPGKEILICEDGVQVDTRADYDCSWKWNVLFLFP